MLSRRVALQLSIPRSSDACDTSSSVEQDDDPTALGPTLPPRSLPDGLRVPVVAVPVPEQDELRGGRPVPLCALRTLPWSPRRGARNSSCGTVGTGACGYGVLSEVRLRRISARTDAAPRRRLETYTRSSW